VSTTRTERDSCGTIEVPAQRLWGAQTQRSLIHFAISSERMPREFIVALALVKQACAKVNRDLGLLDVATAEAIMNAAEEIVAGQHEEEFPLSIWQTGSGTQTHMNLKTSVTPPRLHARSANGEMPVAQWRRGCA